MLKMGLVLLKHTCARAHTHTTHTQTPLLFPSLYSSPHSSFYIHPRSRHIDGIPYHIASYFLSANFPMCNE